VVGSPMSFDASMDAEQIAESLRAEMVRLLGAQDSAG
jgi:hypothetical protein